MDSSENIFIPGIYNYCDRWCERCPLVHRCRLAADEQAYREQGGKQPTNPEELLAYMKMQFEKAHDMLEQAMEKFDINPEDLEWSEEDEQKYREQKQKAREHPLHQLSLDYMHKAHDFLETHHQLQEAVQSEPSEEPASPDPFSMSDALDTINWYHTMIAAKTHRALHGQFDPEWDDPIQNDENGSAKVVSICLKNSMGAWHYIWEHTPSMEDECLTHLAILQQLLTMLNEKFPDYPKFIRPGFDETLA